MFGFLAFGGSVRADAAKVVLADGSIREVSYSTEPDLYYALRGGGNNFGIVTRFDLVTFPQGDLWAGSETFLYTKDAATALNNALYYLNINALADPYAQVILAYAYVQQLDKYIIASDLQYGKPVENPPALQNFTAVPGAIASSLRITNLTGLSLEFNNSNPGGYRYVTTLPLRLECETVIGYLTDLDGCRQTYWTFMFKNSPTLMSDIVDIYQEETNAVNSSLGLVASCVFQPITLDQIRFFSENGGNALGISEVDGPLICTHCAPPLNFRTHTIYSSQHRDLLV